MEIVDNLNLYLERSEYELITPVFEVLIAIILSSINIIYLDHNTWKLQKSEKSENLIYASMLTDRIISFGHY